MTGAAKSKPAAAEPRPSSAEAVSKWLLEHGYPLEFATARMLNLAGFDARQGRFYADETAAGAKIIREVDVLAPLRATDSAASVGLVVECKRTVDKPWVVLTGSAPLGPPDVLAGTLASGNVREFLLARAKMTGAGGFPQFLEIPVRHGFSVVTAYRPEGREADPAYVALSQVTSAARKFNSQTGARWWLAWPVVVIEGQLFETVDDYGSEIREIERARLMWRGATASGPLVIDIVRHDHLLAYGGEAYGALQGINNLIGEAAYDERRAHPDLY